MDIERNPGPLCSLFNYKIHPVASAQVAHRPCLSSGLCCQQQQCQSRISYSRNQLLSFHSMGKLSCTPMLLMKLKSMDILRYHGNRSGWLSKARSMRNGLWIPTTSLNWSHYRFLLNIWSVTSLLQNHEPLCHHCGGYCANNWITIRLEPPSFNSPSFVPLVFFPSELSIYQWQVVTNKEFYCQPRYWPMRPYKDVASWERLRFVQHSWFLPRWICFLPCT